MSSRQLLLAALAAALCCSGKGAEVSLGAARVGAKDVPALAQFYQTVFGLKEVNRLQMGPNTEIMMNFGATPEAAKANPGAQVVVMHSDADNSTDPVPHLILNVADVKAVAKAVVAAGGKITSEPAAFGKTGIWLALGADPAGNRFELLQQPVGK